MMPLVACTAIILVMCMAAAFKGWTLSYWEFLPGGFLAVFVICDIWALISLWGEGLDGTHLGWFFFGTAVSGGAFVFRWAHRARYRSIFRAETGWMGQFLILTFIMLVSVHYLAEWQARQVAGEPYSWADGVSVWPTEMLRVGIVLCVAWMATCAWQRHRRHRRILNYDFFDGKAKTDEKVTWKGVWRRLRERWPKPKSRAKGEEGEIDATEVFGAYVRKAELKARLARVGCATLIYLLFGFGILFLAGGIPLDSHVRGNFAQHFDLVALLLCIVAFIGLVFYVLDAVWLTAKMLKTIAKPFTLWPTKVVERHKKWSGLEGEDLEGFIDVQFAAVKTMETGKLIFLPFIIQFLMLVSRNSLFDNWTWPAGLITIFVCNVVLALTSWLVLRDAARSLRFEALRKIGLCLLDARRALAKIDGGKGKTAGKHREREVGLEELRKRIDSENRGAYAPFIQDPVLLALLIPTGLLGILTILFRALFGVY